MRVWMLQLFKLLHGFLRTSVLYGLYCAKLLEWSAVQQFNSRASALPLEFATFEIEVNQPLKF